MLKGWRTIITNAGIAFGAFLVELNSYVHSFDLTALGLETHAAARIVAGVAVANIALRSVTSTSVGKSE